MDKKVFFVDGEVELYPGAEDPWHMVRVPEAFTDQTRHRSVRGLVPIAATLGNSVWNTSLLPMGDGTQFLPLSARVRKAEGLVLGDPVHLTFVLRG